MTKTPFIQSTVILYLSGSVETNVEIKRSLKDTQKSISELIMGKLNWEFPHFHVNEIAP